MWERLLPALFIVFAISCKDKKQFEIISPGHSGIHFNNLIIDNDSLNVLDVENFYNGGGVGIGDFNNDGLQDIYFTGNAVSNKLYINKGDFKFTDITERAGVSGSGRWCRGVSVLDINNDGLTDIYISASLMKESKRRENILYINKGPNAEGEPTFVDMAAAYGLNDTAHTTMAAFFDYDNDGDLDVYLLNNELLNNQYPNTFRPVLKNGEHPGTDKLLRNDFNVTLNHPVFTDVSKQAGITIEGYGHGVNITDINRDGWKDIYVSNDFLSNNILYINNQKGGFSDEVTTYFKHTAENAMGQDVIDINNDGLVDVIELDMNPEDNFRKKMMLNPISYQRYSNNEYYGYQHQYVRNVLQVNQGPRLLQNDSIGQPVFSEVSFMAGVAQTDWSWAPVVTDFDNDGFRDMIITNGFPKDVTDHDFIAFRNKANLLSSKKELLDQVPEVKISNYAYRNNGGLTFTDVTREWGIDMPSFSNGAAYADLDNDGDMDLVINNINDETSVYRNNQKLPSGNGQRYLQVHLTGDEKDRNGFGAWIELHYGKGKQQVYEYTPFRGYLSSVQSIAHFGLGSTTIVDSLLIKWPNGKMQLLKNVKADQVIEADIQHADTNIPPVRYNTSSALFRDLTDSLEVSYVHHDSDFVDFNIQKILPHKLSEYGPALAVADIDGNGLDDLVSGGSFFYEGQLFLQQTNGGFRRKSLSGNTAAPRKQSEDLGLLLFDADNDHDNDLYIASGGYEAAPNSASYQDRLYINNGSGNFEPDTTALPRNFTSKFCVRASDYDKDGDLDLFVAGRVEPWNYPKPVSSFIYRNDSKNGKPAFTDVTTSVAKDLVNIGLVCDAVFTDFDNDGWQDLVMAGEWMTIRFLKNNKGTFTRFSPGATLDSLAGWWNTIAPGDFDNDGDMDYVVGNLGMNSYYRASEKYPVYITAKDFDNNGSYDAFPSLYLPGTSGDSTLHEYPAHLRDEVAKQMNSMRGRFQNYKSFATASMNEVLTGEERKGALRLKANYFQSVILLNSGNGKFTCAPLPVEAQVSVLNGMVVEDFDGDGNLDVVINGNDFGAEVSIGRYDALNGLYLKGDGKGNFSPLSILSSGIYIPGNGKALVTLQGSSGNCLVAASQNKGALKIFGLKKATAFLPVEQQETYAVIRCRNGRQQKRELYYGASFLSQSSRSIIIGKNIVSVEIFDNKGNKRVVRY